MEYAIHKGPKAVCLKVTYKLMDWHKPIVDYWPLEGFGRPRSARKWKAALRDPDGPELPEVPEDVYGAAFDGVIRRPRYIVVGKDGQWYRVKKFIFSDAEPELDWGIWNHLSHAKKSAE